MQDYRTMFPPRVWWRTCDRDTLTKDFMAALIVVVMLVPQALGYAMVAGMPPYVGLYVSILPPLLYCLFGTSMYLQVGVCAIIAIMTKSGASMIGAVGTTEHVAAGSVLALMAGATLITMGMLRLGFVANFLSHTVISGFVTGSVLTIAATQIRYITGTPAAGSTLYDIFYALLQHLSEIHWPTLAFAVAALAGFILMRRYLKQILELLGFTSARAALFAGLGPFIVVSTAILASWALQSDTLGIRVVGEIPAGLPALGLPDFNLYASPRAKNFPTETAMWLALLQHAGLMAIIMFVESISVAQALAARRRQRIEPNQEMRAVGIASLAAGFSGGYPVAGSFSRSAVNYNAGAQTPLAGIFAAIGIALVVAFFTPLLYYLPLATLGALIILAALTLVDFKILRTSWTYSKRDFFAVAATMVATLLYGVETGLITGLLLSVALHIYHTSRPHFAIVGLVPDTHHFRDVKRHKVITSSKIVSLRVDESLYFANARYLEEVIITLIADYPEAKHLILQCAAVNHVDLSALESLENINRRLKDAGITLHLSEVKGPVMDRLKRSHFLNELSERVFQSQYQAFVTLDPGAVSYQAVGPTDEKDGDVPLEEGATPTR